MQAINRSAASIAAAHRVIGDSHTLRPGFQAAFTGRPPQPAAMAEEYDR